MRIMLFTLLALFATPALAQGWSQYDNGRFGFSIGIPPGFESQGESDNGDGQAFAAAGKPTELLVWGGHMVESFEAEIVQRMNRDAEEGWTVTSQTTTPRWANWFAIKGTRVLYQRVISLCDGRSHAGFRAEYSTADSAEMSKVTEQLSQSLRTSRC